MYMPLWEGEVVEPAAADCTAQVKAATTPLTQTITSLQNRIRAIRAKVTALAADVADD